MEALFRDLKFAAKLLWKDKGFTATALATLSVCIGANAAIFAVVDAVILTPLPFQDSDRIVLMYNSYPNAGVRRASNGVPDYYDRLRDLGDVFEEQALYQSRGLTLGGQVTPQRVVGMAVTPSFFRLLRVTPRLGRIFTQEEGELGHDKKVILSASTWQQLFGRAEGVLGQDLRIDDEPYTIVGVMPEEFVYLRPDIRVWIPAAFTAEETSDDARHSNSWQNIGRLRPEATLEQARAELDALTQANYERFPEFKQLLINAGYHVEAHYLKDVVVEDVRATLYLLWAGALFVLAIGCVNISNLMSVRSAARAKELAMRLALGAGRRGVVRQLLTESVLLGGLGGVLGVLVGYQALGLLGPLGLEEIPRGSEIGMNATVVAVTASLALLMGLLIGAVPLFHLRHMKVHDVLRQEGRSGSAGPSARTLRNALVVAQVGFAFVLLAGAGLLLASFHRVLQLDPGFRDGASVLTAKLSLPEARYPEPEDVLSFTSRLLGRVRSLPGVVSAGTTSNIPFGGSYSDSVILAEGYEMKPGESLVSPNRIFVTPQYFSAMGIPVLEGRSFDERDTDTSARTVIVDERLAKKFWPDTSPLGKRMYYPTSAKDLLAITEETEFLTVVGVVGRVRLRALVDTDERVGAYYLPYAQGPRRYFALAIKAGGEPTSLVGAVRKALGEIDPQLPLYDVQTMQERLDRSLTVRRAPMMLAVTFGAVAAFLAAVGIYGVLAYLVTQRTKEIGIRVALGSSPQRSFRLVLKDALTILGIGFLVGLAGASAVSRFVENQLFGVQPMDGAVLASAAALLALLALAASTLPALRAARIDPVRALNAD